MATNTIATALPYNPAYPDMHRHRWCGTREGTRVYVGSSRWYSVHRQPGDDSRVLLIAHPGTRPPFHAEVRAGHPHAYLPTRERAADVVEAMESDDVPLDHAAAFAMAMSLCGQTDIGASTSWRRLEAGVHERLGLNRFYRASQVGDVWLLTSHTYAVNGVDRLLRTANRDNVMDSIRLPYLTSARALVTLVEANGGTFTMAMEGVDHDAIKAAVVARGSAGGKARTPEGMTRAGKARAASLHSIPVMASRLADKALMEGDILRSEITTEDVNALKALHARLGNALDDLLV